MTRGPARALRPYPGVTSGERTQSVVPAGRSRMAAASGDFALVSCVVASGLHFEGVELAPPGFAISGAMRCR